LGLTRKLEGPYEEGRTVERWKGKWKGGGRGGVMENARTSVTKRKFWKSQWEGEQNLGRQEEKKLSRLVFQNIRKSKERKKVAERGVSMVLWEITLGTAYFLGLKRTYRLALRIQRRIVSPKYPKLRQFLHRFVPLFDSQCWSYSYLPVGNNSVLIYFFCTKKKRSTAAKSCSTLQ